MLRHSLTRRDAFLILLGAFSMHVWTLLVREPPPLDNRSILIDARVDRQTPRHHRVITAKSVMTKTVTEAAVPLPTSDPALEIASREKLNREFPQTSITAHAPGWTLFENLYMSNGTLYILTSSPDTFPEVRLMTSTGLPAENNPGNVAAREPTKENMDFMSPKDALERWGGDPDRGETNKVWTVEGNTLLFNDPEQFLRHYYHLVAELFFGVQAFWHGAFFPPETATPEVTVQQLAFSGSPLHHPPPPPIDRAIFAHSDAQGWRDSPGFNSYFIRAAYPSMTVEHQQDWDDRIMATRDGSRVWRFPVVLLTDRSASHRGRVCGSLTQRTASEAWEGMRKLGKLRGRHIGGWWGPVRDAVWEFAGMSVQERTLGEIQVPMKEIVIPGFGEGGDEILNGVGTEAQKFLPMPEMIVITYISRQGTSRRKLIPEDHDVLVRELEALVKRKNEEKDVDETKKRKWELHVLQAEKMTKDEQVRAAAKTTFMLGVHGNGLTSLVWMKPSRLSTVIELFYPGGFAHDYQWTSRSLGMAHFAVWNDTYHTHPDKPGVEYPEGFQGNQIPVYGPLVAKIIEDRVAEVS